MYHIAYTLSQKKKKEKKGTFNRRAYLFFLWLADGDRERERDKERPLGAEPERDRDLERLEARKKRCYWLLLFFFPFNRRQFLQSRKELSYMAPQLPH